MLIIDKFQTTTISSLDYCKDYPAFNFTSTKMDKLLSSIDDFVEQTLVSENYENVYKKVENYFKSIINKDVFKYIIYDSESLFKTECKKTLSITELLTYRKELRLYSSIEYSIIKDFNENDFNKFFINEIRCILNFIERYKSDDVLYTFPNNIEALKKTFVIDIFNTDEEKLDKELELLYRKVVIIYSAIFSNNYSSKQYRIGILMELKFLKACLHYISFDMDRRLMRIKKYMKNFRIKYLKNEIGVGTSTRLDDLLELPQFHFINLEREVSLNLKNLHV
ncbi:Hypothetical protein SRAE_X000022900 [Strongyloides ratti]|uniref:Uncharacterized protein n=1 Tax=Strongyloides ratti TaxID=34506 RepID=A0A090LTE9_STRRB|nr:Hypothetical protein SRAE_X000022900 [Strongyloides ratti]CEF70899.1 Hypothetical protein SRAE_X000022900 [Strongyloides ratti]